MHANDESLVNWQTVMNRHHLSWSRRSADMSRTAQMVTGRCDPSWSGWSANIFTSLHNTAIRIIKVFCEQTNRQYGHHPSQVVVICPDRDNPPTISPPFIIQTWIFLSPSWPGKRLRVVTIRPECDDLPTCRKLTKGDGPSRPVTDHHQFGNPLQIKCIGQPSKLMINYSILVNFVWCWKHCKNIFVNNTETFGVKQSSLSEGSDIWASECTYL